ncbi:hypothetical protein KY091_02270 [Chlamydia pecorum]|uniref:hypothetical protein n=1 Tax=Chlamydia pecorum TaxID=85991 RepID=UPI001E316CD5|nr:hypothetical protein [Chlamydia pecorum]UFP07158.1 hypothetical protein KY091_02270 [Chlamydia pecorum]
MHQNLEQRKKQYSNKKTFNQNKISTKNKQYVYLFCCFFQKTTSFKKEVEKIYINKKTRKHKTFYKENYKNLRKDGLR